MPGSRLLAFVLIAAAIGVGYGLHDHASYGREFSVTWWIGIALGVVLQRSRFCFFCNLREALEEREVKPLLGILLALAVGTLGAVTIFGAWIPDPSAGYLPPKGHIGPAAWPMALGGVLFGIGMALSGSCISAHFYRLSEGSPLSPVALVMALGGFSLVDLFWNPLYLSGYRTAEAVWFPKSLGFGGALLLQLAVLGAIAWALLRWQKKGAVESEPQADSLNEAVWVRRWPWWFGGIAVGVIATVSLLRTQALGVTAELTRLGHAVALIGGWSPERLEGGAQIRGCIATVPTGLFTINAVMVIGLILGAFVASLLGRHFEWERTPIKKVISAAVGGLLLGVGSRIALGCTIGTLFGGITALSLSGWLFAGGLLLGVWAGLRIRRPWWN